MIILDLGEENHGLVVLKENYNFFLNENPNANTDWNMTWRPKASTRVISTRVQTGVWPLCERDKSSIL